MPDEERGEVPGSLGVWGYVRIPTAKQRAEFVDAMLCDAARAVNDSSIPAWNRAMGVLVLVHESYHLRRWGAAGNEAKVHCQAIRHWRVGAALLGASDATITDLWPWALAAYYEEANLQPLFSLERHPYRDDDCKVPPLSLSPDPPSDPVIDEGVELARPTR